MSQELAQGLYSKSKSGCVLDKKLSFPIYVLQIVGSSKGTVSLDVSLQLTGRRVTAGFAFK